MAEEPKPGGRNRWQRRTVRVPITIALALVLLLRTLHTIGYLAPHETGPQPVGEEIVGGVVLDYDASEGAALAIAEVRGRRRHPGDVREMLYLVREPFDDASFEALGRGGTLGQVADDGASIAWLASKERGERTGPGRVRASAKDAKTIEEKALLSGLVFHPGRTTAAGLTQYQPASGRGTLMLYDTAAGTRRMLSGNVPPGGFAPLADGRTFAIRRPLQTPNAEALVLLESAAPVPPIATNVDVADPRPAFAVAADRRSVVIRVAASESAKALVRWREGDASASTIATSVGAWTLARDGAAWWTEQAGDRVRVFREGSLVGDLAGTDAWKLHPLPSGKGAWVELAEHPARLRLAIAGEGPAPPAMPFRRTVSPPSGWPLALLGPLEGDVALVAFALPDTPAVLEGGRVIGAAFSESGRHLAVHVAEGGRDRIELVDLETLARKTLSEGGDRGGNPAPLQHLSWHGDALLHVWRNREWRLDPRNGLYRVTP